MTQKAKLEALIRARPSEARYDDVRKLLEEHGYELKRQRGSHVTFKRPGSRNIIIPIDGGQKVKRKYLDDLCEYLGLDE